jgi:hypothetical protein
VAQTSGALHHLVISLLCGMMTQSCVNSRNETEFTETTLVDDFRSAVPTMQEFNIQKMEELKIRLLKSMQYYGDDYFSKTLSLQSNLVQTQVCSIMGLLEDDKYDGYPKTRRALSAAPKI